MKKHLVLALALLMVFPMSLVAKAAPQKVDFPGRSAPVGMDLSDVLEDSGYLQPGKTYYIPIMNGNYHLDVEELERYRLQVSIENLNEGGGSRKGGSVSFEIIDGYRYVKFSSTAASANKENVVFRITLDCYDKLDKGWVEPEIADVDVGYGSTSYCSESEHDVDNDAPVVEFSDSVTNCEIRFPDKSMLLAVLVDNTKKNKDEGIMRKINLYSTTSTIQALANKYPKYELKYLTFSTSTTFNENSILRIYAPGKNYLYSTNNFNELKKLSFVRSGDYLVLSNVRTLETYVMSKEELPNVAAGSGTSGGSTTPAGGALTATQAGTAADAAFASGGSSVRFTNVSDVPLDAMKTIASKASAKGIAAVTHMDTVTTTGAIETRLYVYPARATKAFSAVARLDDATVSGVRSTFGNWFKNRVAVIWLGQSDGYGMSVQVATKLNLSGMDTTKLYFYTYSSSTNSYAPIASPSYWIDGSGYLHFTTTVGNYVIVSEGALTSK